MRRGERYTVEFTDGDCRDLVVLSATHVSLDDTVMADHLGSDGTRLAFEPGVQFTLQDVRRVLEFETRRLLFDAS